MVRVDVAGLLNDFHVYDPANIRWTDLSAAASGSPPAPRDGHGFALLAGKLYVHGGYGNSGAPHKSGSGNARAAAPHTGRASHGRPGRRAQLMDNNGRDLGSRECAQESLCPPTLRIDSHSDDLILYSSLVFLKTQVGPL